MIDWSAIPSAHPLFNKSATDTATNMQLLCTRHLLYQGLINRKTRYLRFRNRGDPIALFDDAEITGEIESNNLLDKHSFNNWEGQGLTSINPTTTISIGFDPNGIKE